MDLSARRVLLVGDTHASTRWLTRRVLPLAKEQGVDVVLVLGDFGYWTDASDFLKAARGSRDTYGVDLWFLDGNHEDHPLLARHARIASDAEAVRDPVNLGGSLFYLPRASHVTVGGLDVAVMGGAASIDRLLRRDGFDWFIDEEITEADVAAISGRGVADVLLTHDCPSGWVIPGLMPISQMPPSWQAALPTCWAHQQRLREVFEVVRPRLLVHGHFHCSYEKLVQEEWGEVQVSGLNCNCESRFARTLEARDGAPLLGGWLS